MISPSGGWRKNDLPFKKGKTRYLSIHPHYPLTAASIDGRPDGHSPSLVGTGLAIPLRLPANVSLLPADHISPFRMTACYPPPPRTATDPDACGGRRWTGWPTPCLQFSQRRGDHWRISSRAASSPQTRALASPPLPNRLPASCSGSPRPPSTMFRFMATSDPSAP